MTDQVYVIIVTHDSASVLPLCLEALATQTRQPDRVIIVDSGSNDTGYLNDLPQLAGLFILEQGNIGFSRANNIGLKALPQRSTGMVVFLNPDAFLERNALAEATASLAEHYDVAVVGGRLSGYDPAAMQATGRIDSTGVFRKWYGRWYDRGQGERDCGQYETASLVPAVCGALMCCRLEALAAFAETGVFDEGFFLYKEDIELSLRLRKNGWKLLYQPRVRAFHCRGWQRQRGDVPFATRLLAAKSEILLYLRHPSPYMLWAAGKYLLVRLFRC
ncbi:MAG: glycosyltransferase family 2 protein [Desulfobulbaceae bacterium]|nr:MAG: glycosyltransferase family 2 protein [Desulfobulbaceae bacterium]